MNWHTLPAAVAAELHCPECETPCVTFRGHWYCPKCLRKLVQKKGAWKRVTTPECLFLNEYEKELPCPHGGRHDWNGGTLRFTSDDGEPLQMPIGHLTCRTCGATVDADNLYQVGK